MIQKTEIVMIRLSKKEYDFLSCQRISERKPIIKMEKETFPDISGKRYWKDPGIERATGRN